MRFLRRHRSRSFALALVAMLCVSSFLVQPAHAQKDNNNSNNDNGDGDITRSTRPRTTSSRTTSSATTAPPSTSSTSAVSSTKTQTPAPTATTSTQQTTDTVSSTTSAATETPAETPNNNENNVEQQSDLQKMMAQGKFPFNAGGYVMFSVIGLAMLGSLIGLAMVRSRHRRKQLKDQRLDSLFNKFGSHHSPAASGRPTPPMDASRAYHAHAAGIRRATPPNLYGGNMRVPSGRYDEDLPPPPLMPMATSGTGYALHRHGSDGSSQGEPLGAFDRNYDFVLRPPAAAGIHAVDMNPSSNPYMAAAADRPWR